jgi:hypothetical protein
MRTAIAKLLVMLGLMSSFVACTGSTVVYYQPSWHYNCYPVYDYWGYYLWDECYWEYYNQDGTLLEKDMVAEVADKEALLLEKLTGVYAEKFSLSNEAAAKVAKNVKDFSALSNRSADDIADFAERLYGVNPTEIISAVSSAQVGNNAELDSVIEKASVNLGSNNAQMKALIKELHGKALEANGIEL